MTQAPDKQRKRRLPPSVHAAAEEASPEELGAPTPDARAALMLPPQLLQPGEVILLVAKPSPLFILLSPLKQLTLITLASVACAIVAYQINQPEYARKLMMAGVAVVAGRIFWECLEWLSRVYVLTDRRVIRVAGVLRVSVFEAGLSQIQHSEVYLSLRERLFALGTIGFATAGSAITEAYWQMVANPLEVHRAVVNALRRYRN